MGKLTRYRPLPDQAYDPRVTDLSKPFNVPAATGPNAIAGGSIASTDSLGLPTIARQGQWVNRNVSNTTPVLLPANMVNSVRVLPANPKRTGLIVQNKDPTVTITVSYGNDAGAVAQNVGPGSTVLLDFTTPGDSVYLFNGNAATVQAVVVEIVRSGG